MSRIDFIPGLWRAGKMIVYLLYTKWERALTERKMVAHYWVLDRLPVVTGKHDA